MLNSFKPAWPQRWPRLTIVVVMVLLTLACGFIESESQPARQRVVIRHLTTLTPTTLPTPAQVVTVAAQPVLAAPTPTPVPLPTMPPAGSELVAVPPAATPVNSQPILNPVVVLNVRSGPGTDYPILGKLAPGQSYQVSGKNPEGTWWQIIYPPGSGNLAWVSADAQYSTASSVEAVEIAQLPPPPPPTATPTLAPTPVPTPAVQPTQPALATGAPTALPSQTSVPTGDSTVEPTATSVPGPPGWAFASVRFYPDDDNLLLYGNAINNTGSLQTIESITGAFYDKKGKRISDDDEVFTYWPVNDVSPGSSVPFELVAENLDDDVADFKLSADAEPGDGAPRQDFQFADVKQWTEHDTYCVSGAVQNPGDLNDYLVVAVILYDAQDNIIKFNDSGEFDTGAGVGGGNSPFKICIDPPNQDVARYEVRAWGR